MATGRERLTPYQRVTRALRGQEVDEVPFTSYEDFVPPCTRERLLRNRGLCVVRRIASWREAFTDVKVTKLHYTDEKGRNLVKTEYSTPVGSVHAVQEPSGTTVWTHEYPFKSPEDYKVLKYIFKNRRAVENYDVAAKVMREAGEDYVVMDCMPLEPLQTFISDIYMDPQDYAYEWYDNRDDLLELVAEAARFNEECSRVVAAGPVEIIDYGGNVVPQIVGRENFKTYYMPSYETVCGILQPAGKQVGCHYDADNTTYMDLIAQTPLDFIEAYDPGVSPDVDKAIAAFGDKALWLNWPSPWHCHTEEEIREDTKKLIRQAGGFPKFLIGVTEDPPIDRWSEIFNAIKDGIDQSKE